MLFGLYVYRSLLARFRANALTMLAVCLFVVGASLGLSFYFGLQSMLIDTTPPENIIVLSKGASSEGGSKIALESARKVVLLEGIKKTGDVPLAVRELVTRVYLVEEGTEPVPIRGIDEQSLAVHRATLVTGAMPAAGTLEILLGRRVAERYPNMKVGSDIPLPAGPSKIVGIISAQGGPIEDEVWTPRGALETHLNVKFSSSVTLVADSPDRVQALVDQINFSKDLDAQAVPVAKLRERSADLGTIAKVVLVLLILLSIVATFALATTMSAAAAVRMPELAALAAIGIHRRVLGRIILFESILLGVVGALIGLGVSTLVRSQIGSISLGENPVELASTGKILLIGVGLGVVVGLIGGFTPAMRVARLDIMKSLR